MTKEFRTADERVAYYSKTVEITDTGMVVAEVFAHAADGHVLRRVGCECFSNPFNNDETRFEKAHAWAGKRINLCEDYEVQYKQLGDSI